MLLPWMGTFEIADLPQWVEEGQWCWISGGVVVVCVGECMGRSKCRRRCHAAAAGGCTHFVATTLSVSFCYDLLCDACACRYEEISAALRFAGDLARLYGQRITFHPRCVLGLHGAGCWLLAVGCRLSASRKQPSPLVTPALSIWLGGCS